jgi:hypothetical protein
MKAYPRIPLIMLFLLAMVTIPAPLAAHNGSEHHPTIITFDVPGAFATYPSDINSKGTIIGQYDDANGIHGFVRNCNRKDGDDSCGGEDVTFTNIDGPGAMATFPTSINSSGVITGNYYDTNGLLHGFLRYCNRGRRDRDCDGDDSTFITFDAPRADPTLGTYPTSINPKGVITGYYQTSDGLYHGFLRYCDREDNGGACVAEESHFIEFDVPGSSNTLPVGITPSGTIAGNYLDSSGSGGGFVRTADGKLATFDVSSVADINPSGAIIGTFFANGTVHGYLRMPHGNITTFDVPPVPGATYPTSINAAGAITGDYSNASLRRGFLRNPNGTFETFHVPGSLDNFPSSINASGAITGYYYDANGIHGFLRTPGED